MWALIRWLPDDSAYARLTQGPTASEENLATVLDYLHHAVVHGWRKDTFDPDKWPEHQEQRRRALRHQQPPPDRPPVVPVAVRRPDWPALTEALAAPATTEPEIEEISGRAAHLRLAELIGAA